jgi:peptidoglycan/LPS O-acetylase OafA/YrhL
MRVSRLPRFTLGAATPKPTGRPAAVLGHRPPLDGIRGLAILGVLMLHSTIWGAMPLVLPGGNLGVTVFFVLSGYLITTLLLGEHARTGRIELRSFYIRRAARLLPGLLVLLPAYVLVLAPRESAWQVVLLIGPVLLYLSSFTQAIWGAMGPLAWTWSLSVEEHFYACWPPALRWFLDGHRDRRPGVLGWLRRHPRFLAAGAAIVIVVVATGLRVYLAGSFRWDVFAYYATPTRLDALAVGTLAALFGYRHRAGLPRVAGWAALAAIGWCYANPAFLIGTDPLSLYGLPLCEIATAVLILSVVNRPRGLLARALSLRPLVHLGAVSYGLYLWNLLPGQTWTMVVGRHAGAAGTAVMIVVMFVAVELSYHYVERPVMRWARARLAGRERRGLVAARRRYGVLGLRELVASGGSER